MLSSVVGHCRRQIGWTQQQLARRAGIAHSTLHAIECGLTHDIRLRTLLRLCDALHVTADFLLGINPQVTGHINVMLPIVPIKGGKVSAAGAVQHRHRGN